ncbi:SRPBCC family protein [Modestobacter muralis]|uniref:SRPBCC family protein n=1 Tax=Modestobacter muralis TaxID=1608614 RepID=UPI001B8C0318
MSRPAPSYRFRSTWRVAGTVAEVQAVLSDPDSLTRWWPSVYLAVVPVADGGPDGVGRSVQLSTTGWLPYTLRWTLTITETMTDTGFALSATGDLVGSGRWTFVPDGPEVVVTYDWSVAAAKPLLARLSWLLRPAFAANHRWAMARGEQSLALELRRRRATGLEVPPPPGPTFRRSAPSRGSSRACEG